jgi:hypothetical protein
VAWQGAIHKIAIATGEVTTVLGSPDGSSPLDAGPSPTVPYLWAMVSDGSGNLFVTQRFANKGVIRRVVLATGAVTTLPGSPDVSGRADGIGTAARFVGPLTLASNGEGNLFVADTGDATIREVVIVSTTVVGVSGQSAVLPGPLPASLDRPAGLAVGSDGALYIVESAVGAVLVARF